MVQNPNCHYCRIETTLHVLKDCPKAAHTWRKLLTPIAALVLFTLELSDWILLNLKENLAQNINWRDVFFTTCWRLCSWRNKKLFEEGYQRPPTAHQIIINQASEIKTAFSHPMENSQVTREHIFIRWKLPPQNWVTQYGQGG